MPLRRRVGAEDAHRTEHLHAGRVHRHENLRMLALARCLGVGLEHADQDLAARIAGAADEIFLYVDDPFIAFEARARFEIARVGRGDAGLRSDERRGGNEGVSTYSSRWMKTLEIKKYKNQTK